MENTERSSGGEIARERLHKVHKNPDGTYTEGWLNEKTRKMERIVRHYQGGVREERVFDPETGKQQKVSVYNKEGDTLYFEDTQALRSIEEEQVREKEKAAGSAPFVFTIDQIRLQQDKKIFDDFFLSPDEPGQ